MTPRASPTPPEPLARALRDEPEDDEAWQVLADWLVEHGDPRGDLVVVERALEAADELDRPELRDRVVAVRATCAEQIPDALGAPHQTPLLRRHGFLVGVRLQPFDEPRRVFLRRLLAHPSAALLRTVEIGQSDLDDDGVAALLEIPGRERLRVLRL
ncbi:MAG: TIGR02996 domain-containing protein, partial [Myxococcota bacterium]